MEYDDKHCGITVKLLLYSYVPMTANYSLPQVVSAKGGRFCKKQILEASDCFTAYKRGNVINLAYV